MIIEIKGLTKAQEIAIEDMMAEWVSLGSIGSSRWTSFFADGDGNFQPKIEVNGKKPEFTTLVKRDELWRTGTYKMDFDNIAWRLHDD